MIVPRLAPDPRLVVLQRRFPCSCPTCCQTLRDALDGAVRQAGLVPLLDPADEALIETVWPRLPYPFEDCRNGCHAEDGERYCARCATRAVFAALQALEEGSS